MVLEKEIPTCSVGKNEQAELRSLTTIMLAEADSQYEHYEGFNQTWKQKFDAHCEHYQQLCTLQELPFYEYEALLYMTQSGALTSALRDYDNKSLEFFLKNKTDEAYMRQTAPGLRNIGSEIPRRIEEELSLLMQNYYRVETQDPNGKWTHVCSTIILCGVRGLIVAHPFDHFDLEEGMTIRLRNSFTSHFVSIDMKDSRRMRSPLGLPVDFIAVNFVGLPYHRSVVSYFLTQGVEFIDEESDDILLGYIQNPNSGLSVLTLQCVNITVDCSQNPIKVSETEQLYTTYGLHAMTGPGSCGSLIIRFATNGLPYIMGIVNAGIVNQAICNTGFTIITIDDAIVFANVADEIVYDALEFDDDDTETTIRFTRLIAGEADPSLYYVQSDFS